MLSGCSGGGKSTLLEALSRRGRRVVPELERRSVENVLASGPGHPPWDDVAAFARDVAHLAIADRNRMLQADPDSRIFFDRSLLDALRALEHEAGEPPEAALSMHLPYCPTVS